MENLKIKAVSGQDLDAISALARDGIVLKNAIEFDGNVFFFLLNRFRWEGLLDKAKPECQRIHSSIYFKNVISASYNGAFARHPSSKLLSLMAIHSDLDKGVTLVFSNNSIISLEVSKIEVYLDDMYEGWPAELVPSHPV